MRRFTLCAVSAFLLILVCNAGLAVEGNTRKGKFLYRKNCRTCHGASASDLSPLSKTQAEWKALAEAHAAIPCAENWQKVTDEDRKDIFSYLYSFAKDSPTPAKCE